MSIMLWYRLDTYGKKPYSLNEVLSVECGLLSARCCVLSLVKLCGCIGRNAEGSLAAGGGGIIN